MAQGQREWSVVMKKKTGVIKYWIVKVNGHKIDNAYSSEKKARRKALSLKLATDWMYRRYNWGIPNVKITVEKETTS